MAAPPPGSAASAEAIVALLGEAVVAELQRRHAEPHRVHSTWAQMGERLALAEEVLNGIADKLAFVLAVLFRDAVAEPRRADNAEASAALLLALLDRRLPPARLARAATLVRAAGRQAPPETEDPSLRGDAALFLDIDAAILGADPARYVAYEAALRREHAHLKDDAYAAARGAALQMLLWRDRIYRTDRFFLERERQARRNIEGTIARLGARGRG